MLPIKSILHPTDFSAQAENAYQLACALARDYAAKLVLLHVKVLPTAAYGEFWTLPSEAEESLEELSARLRQKRPHAPRSVDYVIVEGEPATEIVNLAKDRDCDVIVMGTHGRTGLGRLLMGSVAELVMRKAPCPVLTVKMPVAETVAEAAEAAPAAV
jgi:nucleotide-binding universal stress UspA family protein